MRRTLTAAAAFGLLVACAEPRMELAGDDWYDPGSSQDVEELIAFTDENYAIPAEGETTIADLFAEVLEPNSSTYYPIFSPEEDHPREQDCDSRIDSSLPMEIEGIVTVHPRYYFKTSGCNFGDEKYYGSFFIQDRTSGIFVLGDSKVAHFDVGDRVKLRVRSVQTSYDLPMVYVHDVIEVDRTAQPVYYDEARSGFGLDHVGRVYRIEGEVVTEQDTFGQFTVQGDSGATWDVTLDSELSRRGVYFPMGTRIQATGPVIYSYSAYQIVVMNKGQVTVLEE